MKKRICYDWQKKKEKDHITNKHSTTHAKMNLNDDENYCKVCDRCNYTGKYRGAAHSICYLKYKTLKQVPVELHRRWNYDYHSIIRELAEEFEGQFECLERKQRKVQNILRNNKKENEYGKAVTYKINFINSVWFMASMLSKLAHNFAEGLHKIKCKVCKSCLKVNESCMVYCIICGQRIYQKAFLNWFCQYLSFLTIFCFNGFCQYLSFLDIFFSRFFPVKKCWVTSHCLYRDSLTLKMWESAMVHWYLSVHTATKVRRKSLMKILWQDWEHISILWWRK